MAQLARGSAEKTKKKAEEVKAAEAQHKSKLEAKYKERERRAVEQIPAKAPPKKEEVKTAKEEPKKEDKLSAIVKTAGKVLGGKEVGGIKTGVGDRTDVLAGTMPIGPSSAALDLIGGAGKTISGFGAEGLKGEKIFRGILAVKDKLLGAEFGVRGLVATSGIMTWLASDNIIQGMTMYTNKISDNVKFGNISPEEGMAKLDEAQIYVDKARSFININTILNPLLWAARGMAMANADAAQMVLDNNRETISRGSVVK